MPKYFEKKLYLTSLIFFNNVFLPTSHLERIHFQTIMFTGRSKTNPNLGRPGEFCNHLKLPEIPAEGESSRPLPSEQKRIYLKENKLINLPELLIPTRRCFRFGSQRFCCEAKHKIIYLKENSSHQ